MVASPKEGSTGSSDDVDLAPREIRYGTGVDEVLDEKAVGVLLRDLETFPPRELGRFLAALDTSGPLPGDEIVRGMQETRESLLARTGKIPLDLEAKGVYAAEWRN